MLGGLLPRVVHVNVNDDQTNRSRGFPRVSFRTFPSKALMFPHQGEAGAALARQDQVFCGACCVPWGLIAHWQIPTCRHANSTHKYVALSPPSSTFGDLLVVLLNVPSHESVQFSFFLTS